MKPIKTEDGSHTFYVPELDEYYHSIHGSIQESQTVFINAGFRLNPKQKRTIFEMGFGTGLNAFMTFIDNTSTDRFVEYISVEKYPISETAAQLLNYPSELDAIQSAEVFHQMHSCAWNQEILLKENFSFTKLKNDIKLLNFDEFNQFDIIYFDAFAPSAQPDLWEVELLQKLYNQLNEDGILVTYCAKGSFKRALKSVGFSIEALPGPKGKREMTRARK